MDGAPPPNDILELEARGLVGAPELGRVGVGDDEEGMVRTDGDAVEAERSSSPNGRDGGASSAEARLANALRM